MSGTQQLHIPHVPDVNLAEHVEPVVGSKRAWRTSVSAPAWGNIKGNIQHVQKRSIYNSDNRRPVSRGTAQQTFNSSGFDRHVSSVIIYDQKVICNLSQFRICNRSGRRNPVCSVCFDPHVKFLSRCWLFSRLFRRCLYLEAGQRVHPLKEASFPKITLLWALDRFGKENLNKEWEQKVNQTSTAPTEKSLFLFFRVLEPSTWEKLGVSPALCVGKNIFWHVDHCRYRMR